MKQLARVIEVRTMSPGDAVGYGGTWTVPGPRAARVAVLAVGYADGVRRTLGNRARVSIRGRYFPVVGRVSMDLISVLVDDRIRVGDEALLLGRRSQDEDIPAWEWAELCDTIPYEIWTSGEAVAGFCEPYLSTASTCSTGTGSPQSDNCTIGQIRFSSLGFP